MSNVFARKHQPTGIEYYDTATELYQRLKRAVMNPNIFPKRELYTEVVPILNLWHEMRNNIIEAQTRFPTTPEQLEKRKEYIQLAIEAGEALFGAIQDCIWSIDTVTCDNMEQIGLLLKKEIVLLRGWKKNTRLSNSKKQ